MNIDVAAVITITNNHHDIHVYIIYNINESIPSNNIISTLKIRYIITTYLYVFIKLRKSPLVLRLCKNNGNS